MCKIFILIFLFTGFFMLFSELHILRKMAEILRKTRRDMDAASRQRSLADRQNLLMLQETHSIWYLLEQLMYYSGLRMRFPRLTPELWIMSNVVLESGLFLSSLLMWKNIWIAIGVALGVVLLEWIVIQGMRKSNYKKTENSLTKLLDFLGNYSLSAGEITGILGQVSRYMDEPVRGALEACYYEAMTTGDAGMALIGMAEKMEHPKFKELARNMVISIRYCADFSLLVSSSRRSLREYLRMAQERKTMLREAKISLFLLAVMSVVVLLMVNKLTGGAFGI